MHAKKNWSTVLLIKFFTERTFALKVTFLHETARRLNNTNRAIVFAPIANNPYQTNCYARERPHFNIHSCVAICRPSCRTRQKTVHLFFPLFLLTVFFILFFSSKFGAIAGSTIVQDDNAGIQISTQIIFGRRKICIAAWRHAEVPRVT